MRVPTTLAACSLALVGCLNATTIPLGSPSLGYDRARVLPDEVAFYLDEEQVPGDYEEVALIHVTGSEQWSSEAGVSRRLREEAARAGANAVILQPVREPTSRERIRARALNLDLGREGRALAIYVLPESRASHDRQRADSTRGPAELPGLEADYSIYLENGTTLPAVSLEPSGVGQIKVLLPDGSIRYLTTARVRSVTDRDGRDWTRWVLDERRRLGAVTRAF